MSNIVKYPGMTVDARPRMRLDPDSKPAPASLVESMEFKCRCGGALFVANLQNNSKSLMVTFAPHLCQDED